MRKLLLTGGPTMAHVLDLYPVMDDPAPETSSHRRIRWTSRTLSALFGVLFVADIVFAAALGLAFLIPYAGDHLTIGPKGMTLALGAPPAESAATLHPQAGDIAVGSLPLLQRLAHVAMGVVVFLPALMIFWNLRQLFRLYGQGVVFSEANARLIKWIGVWLVANALAPLVSVGVLSVLGLVVDHAWFHADTLPKLVLGGVVYVIALVMQVGHEIEQDRGQFV